MIGADGGIGTFCFRSAQFRAKDEAGLVKTPRLLVIGDIGGPDHYHLGDEAMLEANLDAFREAVPGIELTALSRDPAWTAKRYRVESLPFPKIAENSSAELMVSAAAAHATDRSAMWAEWLGEELVACVRNCTGVVLSGGGNLCASWPEKILERSALLDVTRQFGLPSVVLGQTIGPSLSPDQHRLLESAFQDVRWLGVRDEGSARLAASLGVPLRRVHRQVDDAFFLGPQPVEDARAEKLGEGRPRILVTLDASFQVPERERTLAVLASQLDGLAESLQGEILFVPHVGGVEAGTTLSDRTAGEALAARMRSPMVLLEPWQPREVRWLIGTAAIVISTRYHALVFATAAGVPALGLSVDDYTRIKLRGALAAAGLEGWCMPVADVERGAFLPLAMELWHRKFAVTEKLARLRARAWPEELSRWEEILGALHLELAKERRPPPSTPSRPVFVHAGTGTDCVSREQWDQYNEQGYLRLGRVLTDSQLASLRERMDAIMLGQVCYPTLEMQLDTGGAYKDLPDPVGGLPEATLGYRKVQGLEADPLILELVRRELFREICGRHYGRHAPASIFRVMMMNKPSRKGTYLPWHQDAGDVWKLDRDPLVTSWIALDPATRANGCVQVIPGSHRLGLLSKNGSTLNAEHVARYCPEAEIQFLELEAGEALLLHNWLLHRSGVNRTEIPRRALSVCYMDGRTLNTQTGNRYPLVFGEPEDADLSLPFVGELKDDNQKLRHMALEAERYALSLLEDNRRREEMRLEAERYAKSLEKELAKVREKAWTAAG